MHRQTITLHIGFRTACDVDAVAVYTYTPGRPARLWPWPGTPAEAPEIEVKALFAGRADLWPLMDSDLREEVIACLIDRHEDDAIADRADDRLDAMKEDR